MRVGVGEKRGGFCFTGILGWIFFSRRFFLKSISSKEYMLTGLVCSLIEIID